MGVEVFTIEIVCAGRRASGYQNRYPGASP
ncbi:Uncharacterised protein [Bordetella pertussis]|nr:Uncharacterised protein [Bordetella pertussis]